MVIYEKYSVNLGSPVYFFADDAMNNHLDEVGARKALYAELNGNQLWLFTDETGKLVAMDGGNYFVPKAHLAQYERLLANARHC